jgi:hypothetical protein
MASKRFTETLAIMWVPHGVDTDRTDAKHQNPHSGNHLLARMQTPDLQRGVICGNGVQGGT